MTMKLTTFHSPIYLSLLAVVWPLSIAQAQVIPDNTLGSENSVVVPDVIKGLPSDRIDGGAIRGSNLFQSFQEFNVGEGRGAYFSNPEGIANIFSRVTGNNISQILGTLGVLGNANLYFLNPNGILFGPNARLDIRGSFLATTADSFIFDNNYEFSASNPTAPPLLTVNIPIGLRFRENAGDIVVRTGAASEPVTVTEAGDAGALTDSAQGVGSANAIQGSLDDVNDVDLYQVEVPEGATVTPSTVGGSSVDTRLFLFDQSGLGLAANEDSQGTSQSTLPEITQPGVYYLGISSFVNGPESAEGPIFSFFLDNLSIGANAPLSGWDNFGFDSGSYTISLSPPVPGTGNLAVPPGQTLALIGGNVRLEGGKILSPGSNVYIGGVGGAGVVSLESGWRPILPALLPRADIGIFDAEINVRAGGGGSILLDGGNIDIVGESTRIRAGIEAEQGFSGAQAGDIEINGTGLITIDGAVVSNAVNTDGVGNAGNILIFSDSLFLNNGGIIASQSLGREESNAGDILVYVPSIMIQGESSGIFSQVAPGVQGNSGNISIFTSSLILTDEARINASSFGIGNAGTIEIQASEKVEISNSASLWTTIEAGGAGITGNIIIDSPIITLTNSNLYLNNDGIENIDNGVEDAGNATLRAKDLITIENSSIFTSVNSEGFGNGGNVTITVEGGDLILNEGYISTSTPDGNSRSGDITIQANSLSMNNDSSLRSAGSIIREEPSSAGNISIITTDSVTLDNSSDIQVQAQGRGGNVLIETKKLSLLNGSEIFGAVSGDQPGGTITINASDNVEVSGFIESFPGNLSGSSISVDTIGNGNSGNIVINTRQLLVENGGSISSTASGGASDPSISGAGGTITINASESVNVRGATPDGFTLSAIEASTAGIGKGGDIQINTQQLTVSDGATIRAITTGDGQGGTLEINADSVDVIGTRQNIFPTIIDVSTNGIGASGNAGNIRIVTGQLSVSDGAEINASTSNFGQGGNINIFATESVNISGTYPTFPIGSQIVSQTFGSGQGGTIYIESPILILDNRGRINSQTSSSGNAGNVIVNAPNSIALGDNSQITVQTSNLGSPGDITITTDALTIGENAQLSATIQPTSANTTGGGSIALNANSLDISGQLGIFAETQSQAPAGSLTINPNDNPDLNIRFTDDGFISARTTSSGQGGNINLSAPNLIDIRGQGKITAETSGSGNAGNIQFTSQQLNLADGVGVSATTTGTGNAGNITMKADTVTITGESAQGNPSYVESEVGSTGMGNGGGITIETGTLSLEKGGFISASTQGEGNAGQISIYARDNVTLTGESSQGDTSGVLSEIGSTGVGNSGGITIETGTLSLEKGGFISTNIEGEGDSGLISIRARNSVTLTGKSSQGDPSALISEVGGVGNSRGITLETSTLLLTQGSHVSTSTFGNGNAGNIEIVATTQIDSSGTFFETDLNRNIGGILAFTTTAGRAGNITIATPLFNLHEGAGVEAFTQGTGSAGRITITSPQAINVGESSRISVETSAAGRPGDIVITTDTLNLGTNAQLSATATVTSTNPEGGGSINLNTNNLNISGKLGIFAETQSQAPAGSLTINPNDNPNLNIRFTDDGFISARTTSSGQGGNINLSAPNLIDIRGQGKITAETSGSGNAGNVQITSQTLNLADGVEVSATTTGTGNAGNIVINTPQGLTIDSNSRLTAETQSEGRAGNITVTAQNITLGKDSELSARATQSSTNQEEGGSINLNSANLNISGKLGIFAETQGQAPAGTLTINPDSDNPDLNIRFTDDGFISALTSASGKGGNINLSAPNLIDIRGQGKITTETSGSGNAGNITLSSQRLNLIEGVAVSASSSNLGQGGSLTITAPEAIHLQKAQLSTQATNTGKAGNINLQTTQLELTDSSAITASSQVSQGGDLQLQNLDTLTVNNSQITASTVDGNAGSLTINANQNPVNTIQLDQGSLAVKATGTGNSGNLTVNAHTINLDNQSEISASTNSGQGRSITLTNVDTLTLNNSSQMSAITQTGSAGNIMINGGENPVNDLQIQENSQISAQANGVGGEAGNVTLNTRTLNLEKGSVSASNQSGKVGGDVTLENLETLTVKQGEMTASTVDGTAGSLTINVNQNPVNTIQLDQGSLAVKATGTGNSGNLTVNAHTVNLDNQSEISASTKSGTGGNINLPNLNTLQINNSEISAATASGTAGSININSRQSVALQNQGKISVEATEGGTAGDLTLQTDTLTLTDSRISVSSLTGQAGNITIQTKDLRLNQGAITAETGKTGVESGANINLNVSNFMTLRMENDSLISATAYGFADGGNVTINAPLLIAMPGTGSGNDIIAKAFFGDGGRITINALGIFGVSEGKALIGNQSNDIDASSEYGASGVITLNQAIDPNRGLVLLPGNVVDPSQLIDQNVCQRRRQGQSQLTTTGKTDLPPSLENDFSGSSPGVNLVEPSGGGEVSQELPLDSVLQPMPAQGWRRLANGQMMLVGEPVPGIMAQRSPFSSQSCLSQGGEVR